ncbi:ferric reductase like transmembrane component [Botrytis cinerea]
MIAWWVRNGDGLTISLLVKTRRGFTSQLSGLVGRPSTALIDGPYGREHDLGKFGTVVMFATGIGIAAHMPYIKDLVSGYNSCEVRTRRILLVWQLEMEAHQQWVKDWMDEVIEMDTGRILEIELYVLKRSNHVQLEDMDDILKKHNLTDPKIVLYGTHQKIHKIFAPANVRGILNGEMSARKGSLAISVCANKAMCLNIRNIVQKGMDNQMRLIELEFQPSLHSKITSVISDDSMDFSCAGLA